MGRIPRLSIRRPHCRRSETPVIRSVLNEGGFPWFGVFFAIVPLLFPAWTVNTFVCYSLSKARARTAFSASLKTYPMPVGAADPLGHSSPTA